MLQILTNAVQASGHEVIANVLHTETLEWYDYINGDFKHSDLISGTDANISMSGQYPPNGYHYEHVLHSTPSGVWRNGQYLLEVFDYSAGSGLVSSETVCMFEGEEVGDCDTYALLEYHEAMQAAFRASFGFGSGANVVSIYLKENDPNGAPIYGEQVRIYDIDLNQIYAFGSTNPSGLVVFALDDSAYKVLVTSITHHSYSGIPYDLNVQGTTTAEYYGLPFLPTQPTAPNTCYIYDWVYNIRGEPLAGVEVNAVLAAENTVFSSGGAIVPREVVTHTDASGYFQLEVIRSSQMSISTNYHFYIKRAKYSKLITAPDQSAVRLYDL